MVHGITPICEIQKSRAAYFILLKGLLKKDKSRWYKDDLLGRVMQVFGPLENSLFFVIFVITTHYVFCQKIKIQQRLYSGVPFYRFSLGILSQKKSWCEILYLIFNLRPIDNLKGI